MLKSGVLVMPVPDSATVCGLLGSLSVTLRVAVAAPVTVGVKVTLMPQFAPTASVAPQVVVCAKDDADAPLMVMATPLRAEVLLLVRVAVCGVLVVVMF